MIVSMLDERLVDEGLFVVGVLPYTGGRAAREHY